MNKLGEAMNKLTDRDINNLITLFDGFILDEKEIKYYTGYSDEKVLEIYQTIIKLRDWDN